MIRIMSTVFLQNHGRGHQINIAHALLLLVQIVFGNDVAAKVEPLGEGVIRLDLVGRRRNFLSHSFCEIQRSR
ncbi:hypothetical protein CTP10_R69770 (plasmid) [Cupriavidus sp. P-10]|nr:hypothetical protein CTP10_R69770 [Cupriavidus sp. P-10]